MNAREDLPRLDDARAVPARSLARGARGQEKMPANRKICSGRSCSAARPLPACSAATGRAAQVVGASAGTLVHPAAIAGRRKTPVVDR